MKVTEAHMEAQENKDILEKVKEVLGNDRAYQRTYRYI